MRHRILILVVGWGCEDPRLTWVEDAQPILEERCVDCHHEGGIGPRSLVAYADVRASAERVAEEVAAGRMPPFPADPDSCRPLEDPRVLPAVERSTLLDWLADGAPRGDGPVPQTAEPAEALGPPTDEIDSGVDYSSLATGDDDYRCFDVDPVFEDPGEAIAFSVRVEGGAAVHHATIFAVPASTADVIEARDAADPGAGWECFGLAGVAEAVRVALVVPGGPVRPYPAGAGVRLPAHVHFVVQVHYHFDDTGRSSSRLFLQVWRPSAPLTGLVRDARAGTTDFLLPAGDPDVEATGRLTIVASDADPAPRVEASEGRAWSAGGHLHLLGSSIRLDLVHPDGARDCLLDVPEWRYEWQSDYRFAAPIDVVAGDRLETTCRWNNSAENQPAGTAPRDVSWGFGTDDEMCLAWVVMTDL